MMGGPDPGPAEDRSIQATYAQQYEALWNRDWWWRARRRFVLARIARLARQRPLTRILDIGCGNGLLFDDLLAHGDVMGIEPDGGLVDPNGRPEHFSAFFSPSAKQLSPADAGGTTWPNGGIAGGSTGNDFAFPVVIDTYPDALPILYYRRTPGVENVASSSPVRVASSNPTTEIAPYYLDENKEYTAAPALTALNGTQFDQRKGSFAAGDTTSFADFGELVQTAGTTPAARGGYVLLSAGSDRTYGKVGGKFDDGVVVGGH